MDAKVASMLATSLRLFPNMRGDRTLLAELRSLCLRAYEATDHDYVRGEGGVGVGGRLWHPGRVGPGR